MTSPLESDLRAGLDPAVLFGRAFGAEPHAWQLDYLHETRPTVLLKGRQIGASLSAAGLAIHQAIYRPDSLAAIISPSQRQSSEVATRARTGLRNLGVPLVGDSATTLRLRNGSRILSLPGSPKSVRGWSADLLVLDEAAYLDHETIVAARALIAATGGRLLVQSTPDYASGDFYELHRDADSSWASFTVRSEDVPTVSREFLAQERRALSPERYRAEYDCEFRQAGAGVFTPARIASLVLQPKESK